MTESLATTVRVEMVRGRARFIELRAGTFLSPRPLNVEGPFARLALVGRYATLLAGDDLRVEIDVGSGVRLELVEPSGTVAYDAQGGSASWSASVRVGVGAQLIWRAAPFVITAGADIRRHTRIELADGARALLSETIVLGRAYEDGGGPLRATMQVYSNTMPLLVEDLDLRNTAHRDLPGIIGRNRTLASVLLVGARPAKACGEHETLLAGAGALARALAPHAHEAQAAVDASWERWSELVEGRAV
ncbi:urease accessory protein UreD [Rhodococcus sp. YH3-3]|uniref:urease accessory protein UreD n=1 Tax=Rhodococcus sp. YH3-3 TaxID=1803579 RepID=UPI0007DB2C7F|nr:urease accessory protein UreD [Rhodococcus sp. YH3-3]